MMKNKQLKVFSIANPYPHEGRGKGAVDKVDEYDKEGNNACSLLSCTYHPARKFITETHIYNIHVHVLRCKIDNFLLKNLYIFLFFLLKTLIVGGGFKETHIYSILRYKIDNFQLKNLYIFLLFFFAKKL